MIDLPRPTRPLHRVHMRAMRCLSDLTRERCVHGDRIVATCTVSPWDIDESRSKPCVWTVGFRLSLCLALKRCAPARLCASRAPRGTAIWLGRARDGDVSLFSQQNNAQLTARVPESLVHRSRCGLGGSRVMQIAPIQATSTVQKLLRTPSSQLIELCLGGHLERDGTPPMRAVV